VPLNAREVRTQDAPAPNAGIPKDIIDAIDALLRPDWADYEVLSLHGPPTVGRRFALPPGQEQWVGLLAREYRAAGWDVMRVTDTLIFSPRYLRERLINQTFPGR
jgi:hypothetical protein